MIVSNTSYISKVNIDECQVNDRPYNTQYVKVDWNNPDHKHVIQQLKHRVVCNGSLVFEAIKWLRTRAQSHWSRRGNIFYFKSHEDALIFKIKFSGAVA